MKPQIIPEQYDIVDEVTDLSCGACVFAEKGIIEVFDVGCSHDQFADREAWNRHLGGVLAITSFAKSEMLLKTTEVLRESRIAEEKAFIEW
jgi:hypothetical protein